MPAQRIEGNQDGAGDYNDGGEEEHCSLRHRAALDLRLLLFLNQRAALWCVQASTAELGALYAPNLRYGVVVGRWTFAQGLHAARALLPDHSDRPLFAWSFLAFEVRLLKGELALRIERHEVGPTRRKDLFHQACFRFLAGV